MTLAVVAILGHFSKTVLLFFIPQTANFVYSAPQLFKLLPCPRHRLPKYDPETDLLDCSMASFKESDLRLPGRLTVRVLETLRLLRVKRFVWGIERCWINTRC